MKVKTHKKNQGSVRLLKVSMVWAVLLILMAVILDSISTKMYKKSAAKKSAA